MSKNKQARRRFMVILRMVLCEGESKGKRAEGIIRLAFQRYFSLEVKAIEKICNERRENLLKEWNMNPPNSFMTKYNLSKITYERGIWEATPTFDLYEPKQIDLCIFKTITHPKNPSTAMSIQKLDEEGKMLRLNVFLKTFEERGKTFHWIGYCMSIDKCTFHELLHACGDASWRYRHDGLIRHNIIGIEAIQQLLNESEEIN